MQLNVISNCALLRHIMSSFISFSYIMLSYVISYYFHSCLVISFIMFPHLNFVFTNCKIGAKNEGLSWGRSAVEMGLARMSAMGVFKPQEGTEEKKSQSFSSFNASMPIKPTSDKNETKSNKKPFGF